MISDKKNNESKVSLSFKNLHILRQLIIQTRLLRMSGKSEQLILNVVYQERQMYLIITEDGVS